MRHHLWHVFKAFSLGGMGAFVIWQLDGPAWAWVGIGWLAAIIVIYSHDGLE